MITLITGGARSGKSIFAEKLLSKSGRVYYIATAQALDDEMEKRIMEHQKRRDKKWITIEDPHYPANALTNLPDKAAILLDCVTLYISNCFGRGMGFSAIKKEFSKMIKKIKEKKLTAVFITNEVGSGIVPANEMSRDFRDTQGLINQFLAKNSDKVYLCVSGIALQIKGEKHNEKT